MSLFSPTQNYDHLLDVVSGFDGMHDLQFHAVPADEEEFFRGSLVSLDSNGRLVAGLGAVDSNAMPMWAINATDDFDASSEIGNISGAKVRQDGQLLGGIGCFVATGGFELVTTEFDPAAVASYVPNAPLIHFVTTPGFVTAGSTPLLAAESIVGVVSKGVRTEVYGQSVLQFWPTYQPARA